MTSPTPRGLVRTGMVAVAALVGAPLIRGKKLRPDAWKVVGTARNAAGASGKKKVRLVVVRP